jgi:hypothetical protein
VLPWPGRSAAARAAVRCARRRRSSARPRCSSVTDTLAEADPAGSRPLGRRLDECELRADLRLTCRERLRGARGSMPRSSPHGSRRRRARRTGTAATSRPAAG